MVAAFPNMKTASKANVYRKLFNDGNPPYHGAPLEPSLEYGNDGQPLAIQRCMANAGGPRLTESKVREIVRQEIGLTPRVTINIASHAGKTTSIDCTGKHAKFAEVMQLVSAGIHAMLVGPAGCGKTHLAGQIAEALGMPFSFNSMASGVTESSLLGRMLPQEDGAWKYQPAPWKARSRRFEER